ncbi:hypothetical protein ACFLT0_01860 [Chloroflexota bacterium]
MSMIVLYTCGFPFLFSKASSPLPGIAIRAIMQGIVSRGYGLAFVGSLLHALNEPGKYVYSLSLPLIFRILVLPVEDRQELYSG